MTFFVRDGGVGVPRAQRKRVFERFYRVTTQHRKNDGSGLGLYIARGIVLAHGGEIWLEPGNGAGTTVGFCIPKRGSVDAAKEQSLG